MAHVSQRWLGIVTRIVGSHYLEPEMIAYGPILDEHGGEGARSSPQSRLEIVIVQPQEPSPDSLTAIRHELAASDLPVDTDVRALADLTIAEQEDALQRGIRFGN